MFLIEKHENVGIKYWNDSKAFVECSNAMDYIYNNMDDYNPTRKRKILLIVFDDMIADIMAKKIQAIIKKPFAKCRKSKLD